MTTKSLLVCQAQGGVNSFGVFSDTFVGFSGYVTGDTNEATVFGKVKAGSAFTLMNIATRMISNGGGTTEQFTSRINGADGNQIFNVPGTTTGWLTDATHTDSISPGDTYYMRRTSGNFLDNKITLASAVVQNSSPLFASCANGNSGNSFATAVAFIPVVGYPQQNVEATAGQSVRAAGTWQNLEISVANAPSGTVNVKSRDNGVDGNQLISFSSGTGFFQDTTHSDSVASNDFIAIAQDDTSGGGSYLNIYSEFAGTLSAHEIGTATSTATGKTALGFSSTGYSGWGGELGGASTESDLQVVMPYGATVSELRAHMIDNANTAVAIKTRINSADGNCLVSFIGGATGIAEDNTHTDTLVSTDLFTNSITTGAGSGPLAIRDILALLDDGSVSGSSVHYTDSVTEAASASDTPSGSQGYPVSASDTVTATDTPNGILVQTSAITEPASAANTQDATIVHPATVSESANAAATQSAIFVVAATKNVTIFFMG